MSVKLSKGIKIVENDRKFNTKASEEYVHVEFNYNDPKTVWDGWVPVEYRRTGLSIKTGDNDKLYRLYSKFSGYGQNILGTASCSLPAIR